VGEGSAPGPGRGPDRLDARGAGLIACTLADFHPRRDWDLIRAQHEAFEKIRDELAGVLEPDARLAAPIGWHHAVYLDRPVHSLHWAVKRAGDPAAVEPLIDEHEIDTVLLSPLVPGDRPFLPYFDENYSEVLWLRSVYVVAVR
jgi:hypothetical protein